MPAPPPDADAGLRGDALSCEADQRAWLSEDYIRQRREARQHACHRRVSEHSDVGQPRAMEPADRRRRFRHLHQRNQTLLHARPA